MTVKISLSNLFYIRSKSKPANNFNFRLEVKKILFSLETLFALNHQFCIFDPPPIFAYFVIWLLFLYAFWVVSDVIIRLKIELLRERVSLQKAIAQALGELTPRILYNDFYYKFIYII